MNDYKSWMNKAGIFFFVWKEKKKKINRILSLNLFISAMNMGENLMLHFMPKSFPLERAILETGFYILGWKTVFC